LKQHTQQLGQQIANTSEATIRRVLRDAKRELSGMLFEQLAGFRIFFIVFKNNLR
jgi:hypothetical protein